MKDLFERLDRIDCVAILRARRRDNGVGARLDGAGDVSEIRGGDLEVGGCEGSVVPLDQGAESAEREKDDDAVSLFCGLDW